MAIVDGTEDARTSKTAILFFSSLAVALALFISGEAVVRLRPHIITETAFVTKMNLRSKRVETDIEIDGKKHKVVIDVPIHEPEIIQSQNQVMQTGAPQERMRIYIVCGCAGLLGLFSILALGLTLYHVIMTGKNPPKHLKDWLERIVAILAGILIGFFSGSDVKYQTQENASHHTPEKTKPWTAPNLSPQ